MQRPCAVTHWLNYDVQRQFMSCTRPLQCIVVFPSGCLVSRILWLTQVWFVLFYESDQQRQRKLIFLYCFQILKQNHYQGLQDQEDLLENRVMPAARIPFSVIFGLLLNASAAQYRQNITIAMLLLHLAIAMLLNMQIVHIITFHAISCHWHNKIYILATAV